MDTQEKNLAEQFRSLRIATHRYLRGQYRKAAEETNRENRKEIIDKIFSCLSAEEQKTMCSYLERVAESLKSETKESEDDCYDFPFNDGYMSFHPHFGGFGHSRPPFCHHGHRGERTRGFAMPFQE
jgi:hypothetical protein